MTATAEAGAPAVLAVDILADNLKRAVSVAARAVDTKGHLPITGTLKLSTDRGRLRVDGTDLAMAASAWTGAMIQSEGGVCVDAGEFRALVSTLPPATVRLEMAGGALRLICARTKADFPTRKAEDFPRIPDLSETEGTELDWATVKALAAQVAFACADDDARPLYRGVCMEGEDGKLAAGAADGFRLAALRLAMPYKGPRIVIPGEALGAVAKLPEPSEPVLFRVNPQGTQCSFATMEWEFMTQLIQGTYPNYRQMIVDEGASVSCAHDELASAIQTVRSRSRRGSGNIRLRAHDGALTLWHDGEGVTEAVVEAEVEGEAPGAMKTAINEAYLTEAVGAFPTKVDRVVLRWASEARPIRITSPQAPGYDQIVMPVFLQW